MQPKKQKVATEKTVTETVVKAMADAVDENLELTDKQKEFCVRFMQNRNATLAYKKAYDCSYNTARVEGCKSLTKPNIQNELKRLRQIKNSALGFLCGDDVVEILNCTRTAEKAGTKLLRHHKAVLLRKTYIAGVMLPEI